MQQAARTKIEAGNVSFVIQHELWDGNLQDHSDQGVVILVEANDTTLAAVQLLRPGAQLCLWAGKGKPALPHGPCG